MQSYPLRRMCFGQYQASLAELGRLENGTAMSTAIVTLTVCEQLVHKYLYKENTI